MLRHQFSLALRNPFLGAGDGRAFGNGTAEGRDDRGDDVVYGFGGAVAGRNGYYVAGCEGGARVVD